MHVGKFRVGAAHSLVKSRHEGDRRRDVKGNPSPHILFTLIFLHKLMAVKGKTSRLCLGLENKIDEKSHDNQALHFGLVQKVAFAYTSVHLLIIAIFVYVFSLCSTCM